MFLNLTFPLRAVLLARWDRRNARLNGDSGTLE